MIVDFSYTISSPVASMTRSLINHRSCTLCRQIKAKHTLYQLFVRFTVLNTKWEIEEYDPANDPLFASMPEKIGEDWKGSDILEAGILCILQFRSHRLFCFFIKKSLNKPDCLLLPLSLKWKSTMWLAMADFSAASVSILLFPSKCNYFIGSFPSPEC